MKFRIRKRDFSLALGDIQAISTGAKEFGPKWDRVMCKVTAGKLTLSGGRDDLPVVRAFSVFSPNTPLSPEMENGECCFIIGTLSTKLETGVRDETKITVVYTPGSSTVVLEFDGEKVSRSAYRVEEKDWLNVGNPEVPISKTA